MSDQTAADNVRPMDRAKEAVHETVEKTREQLDSAREKFQEVADQVGERFHETSEEVRRRAEKAREAARQRYEETSQHLREGYARAREDLGGVTDEVIRYTRDNPGQALLIAGAAGFILGLLIRPRRRYHD